MPSVYCPLRSPVFLESCSHLLRKPFGLHPLARPKAQTSVRSHCSSNRCVHFHRRSSLLHFCFLLFTSAMVSPNDPKSSLLTERSPSLLRCWHCHSTGWTQNLCILTKSFFLFLRKLPCLFISASTSCILPTVRLQLRNSTKTIKPSFPKLSIPSILLPLFLAFVQFYSFLWQKTIFFTMSIFISGWMVHSSLTACWPGSASSYSPCLSSFWR